MTSQCFALQLYTVYIYIFFLYFEVDQNYLELNLLLYPHQQHANLYTDGK